MVGFPPEKYQHYKLNYQNHGPKFVFPQQQQTDFLPNQHQQHSETFPDQQQQKHGVDDIITSVKDVVTEIYNSYTTTKLYPETTPETTTASFLETTSEIILETSPQTVLETTTATILETVTESNSTIITAMQEVNNTIMNGLDDMNNTMVTTLQEVSTMVPNAEEVNATMATTLEEVTKAVLVEENTNNAITSMITEATTELQENATSMMDWLSRGEDDEYMGHNLTMTHHGSFEEEHKSLYIILGVILGILVVISLILLMIYVTYKRKNLYTLQEQSHSSVKMVNKPMTATDDGDEQDIEQAIEYDKNCYKF